MKFLNKSFEQNNEAALKGIAIVSFLWSASTLMVFSVLPAFLVDELKMGHSRIGLLEAFAISSSFAAKFLSGYLSDVYGKRKPLIIIGSVLTAITKPIFALCTSAGLMFGIKLTDRLSKGIRSAPTDALIADLSNSEVYASNFGFRQTLYTLGQVAGALIAMVVLLQSNNNYRLLFALSSIPAFLALIILWFFVRPNSKTHPRQSDGYYFKKLSVRDLKMLPESFWWLMVALFFLMLARFSEAFLTLKAKDVGLGIAYLPLLIIIMDMVHAAIAWPSGQFADRFSRKLLLFFGLLLFFLAHLTLAAVSSVSGIILGIILLGLHMGISQGLLKALIAESSPAHLRGTAYALFFMISGCALFLANTIAGYLSQNFGLYASFLAGAGFTGLSAITFYMVFIRQGKKFNALARNI